MSECMKMYQWLCTCLAPHSFASDMLRNLLLIMSLTRLLWKRMVISNFDVWCDEEYITTYLGHRYVLCHNPALEHRYRTGQYWYVSYWPKYSSDISIYCYPIITLQQLVVALQYWTPFSVQTLEQRHLSTRLHSSDLWLLDLDEQLLMANYKPGGFKGHWYLSMHVAVGRWQLAMWPRSDLNQKKDIVSIYPRCWIIDKNVIVLRWWPFWKWCQIGSPSQFGDCGIHFSCWYRSQWPNKTGFICSWRVHVGSIWSMVQLMSFLLISRTVIWIPS